jgi:hypothetical protein
MATPDDEILVGYPTGDVDCDGTANSQDALLILQFVAQLIERNQMRCFDSASVSPGGGVNSFDALAILQSEAGLIGALPLPQ